MKVVVRVMVLLTIATLMVGCNARMQPLENPESSIPSGISDSVTLEAIGECISLAARRNGWNPPLNHEPGRVTLYRKYAQHEMEVDVHYDHEMLRVEYRSSKNLLYKKNGDLIQGMGTDYRRKYTGPVIHKNYNFWVNELIQAIHSEIRLQGGDC